MIVMMAGLPGTGKSTLARELAQSTGGCVVGKDEIRAAVFAPKDIEFSITQDDFVMEIMLDAADYLLRKSPARVIILDGRTFSRRYQIDRVVRFAEERNQGWQIIECVCADESAHRRLDLEPDANHPATNRSYALYLEVKARFEPIAHPKSVVSTDRPLEECVKQALAAIR